MKWVACLVVDSNGDDLFTQMFSNCQISAHLDIDPGGIVGVCPNDIKKGRV